MKNKRKKSAQDISVRQAQDKQDDIFRKMSADKKLEIAAGLWLLAKELNPNNIRYGEANRSSAPSYKRH